MRSAPVPCWAGKIIKSKVKIRPPLAGANVSVNIESNDAAEGRGAARRRVPLELSVSRK